MTITKEDIEEFMKLARSGLKDRALQKRKNKQDVVENKEDSFEVIRSLQEWTAQYKKR
jgi:hypothetical protein